MKCINCGAELPDGTKYCSECDMAQPTTMEDNRTQNDLTFKQYYTQITDSSEKKWVNIFLVVCCLTAIFSIYLFFNGLYLSVLDAVVYTIGAIMIGIKKNWIIALVITCYIGLIVIFNISVYGIFSWNGTVSVDIYKHIFILACGIKTTITLFNVKKAYENYRRMI